MAQLEVIQRYAGRIAYRVSEPDCGVYDALNKGLRLATGDAVGFLHADNRYADDRVLSRIAAALADPAIDACYGDLRYVRKDAPRHVVRYWRAGPYHPRRLRRGWMPSHPTFYARRTVYQRLGASISIMGLPPTTTACCVSWAPGKSPAPISPKCWSTCAWAVSATAH